MIWLQADVHKPSKPGQFYVWHAKYGKCVMGYNDGWGANPPVYWLDNDQCPHQNPDGSF